MMKIKGYVQTELDHITMGWLTTKQFHLLIKEYGTWGYRSYRRHNLIPADKIDVVKKQCHEWGVTWNEERFNKTKIKEYSTKEPGIYVTDEIEGGDIPLVDLGGQGKAQEYIIGKGDQND